MGALSARFPPKLESAPELEAWMILQVPWQLPDLVANATLGGCDAIPHSAP